VQNSFSIEVSLTPSGYSVDKEISVTYKGEKGSVMSEENGFQMFFKVDKDLSHVFTNCLVQVSNTEGAYSRLPSKSEVVSRYYHIYSSKKLNTAVTLKIFHRAAEADLNQLCFLTSTDKSPPYDYEVLHGGQFTSTYGEITVKTFSFYTICKLCCQLYVCHGVRGVLSYMETRYEASLYCSIQPTLQDSEYRLKVYMSVVKNCDIFSQYVKMYIQEEFEDKVKLISRHVVIFNEGHDCITAQHDLNTDSPQSVFLKPTDHNNTLCHVDISDYVDGYPPLLVYDVHGKMNCSFDLKFTLLEGLQEAKQFTLNQWDLPGMY